MPEVQLVSSGQSPSVDGSYFIHCIATAGDSPIHITWYRDGHEIQAHRVTRRLVRHWHHEQDLQHDRSVRDVPHHNTHRWKTHPLTTNTEKHSYSYSKLLNDSRFRIRRRKSVKNREKANSNSKTTLQTITNSLFTTSVPIMGEDELSSTFRSKQMSDTSNDNGINQASINFQQSYKNRKVLLNSEEILLKNDLLFENITGQFVSSRDTFHFGVLTMAGSTDRSMTNSSDDVHFGVLVDSHPSLPVESAYTPLLDTTTENVFGVLRYTPQVKSNRFATLSDLTTNVSNSNKSAWNKSYFAGPYWMEKEFEDSAFPDSVSDYNYPVYEMQEKSDNDELFPHFYTQDSNDRDSNGLPYRNNVNFDFTVNNHSDASSASRSFITILSDLNADIDLTGVKSNDQKEVIYKENSPNHSVGYINVASFSDYPSVSPFDNSHKFISTANGAFDTTSSHPMSSFKSSSPIADDLYNSTENIDFIEPLIRKPIYASNQNIISELLEDVYSREPDHHSVPPWLHEHFQPVGDPSEYHSDMNDDLDHLEGLESDPLISINRLGDRSSALQFRELKAHHSGNYTCLAANEAGSDQKAQLISVRGVCAYCSKSMHFDERIHMYI